ncbi:MAG: amidohydrolase family protein [Acidobacteria bacterium]|nr:amidohydrolase family protein [Acidobacteriota bacterium]
MTRRLLRASLLIWTVIVTACAPAPPDLVLTGGRIFTATDAQPWVEALAIRGDRIIAVGNTAEITALAGPTTQRRALEGRIVVPGFNDAHVIDPGGDADAVRAVLARGLAMGVTSVQWFAGERTVAEVARVLREAASPARVRVFRMPRPGPAGMTIDSRPHLPPQPTLRIDIRGFGFRLGSDDRDRIRQAVGWAFGTEDLLAVEATDEDGLRAYEAALTSTGVAEVWRRKRPRIDWPRQPLDSVLGLLRDYGISVVQGTRGDAVLQSRVLPVGAMAVGTGSGIQPFEELAWLMSPERGATAWTGIEALTAMTRGGALVELQGRDKGFLAPGALADVAVLSDDPLAMTPARAGHMRSLLTLVGGEVVHDVP